MGDSITSGTETVIVVQISTIALFSYSKATCTEFKPIQVAANITLYKVELIVRGPGGG